MADQLVVESLPKTFDEGNTIAVANTRFTVGESKIFCLLGPSDCGKTTTFCCIAGVEQPDRGQIEIGGRTVASNETVVKSKKRGLGMVYQNYAISPHKSVYEKVVISLKHSSDLNSPEYEERVMDILQLVGISELNNTPATDLSGGQQQRTTLARALVHNPDLLLLDEPLSNRDAKLRAEMRNEIQRIQTETGVSIVYVTHDQEEAFYLADVVAVMRDGSIVERGRPSELYNKPPKKAFTREFVGRWNKLLGQLNGNAVIFLEFPFVLNRELEDEFDKGDDVLCFIRPTDISLEHGGDTIEISGEVIAGGVIGELYEQTIVLDGTGKELVIQTYDHLAAQRGDVLSVSVSPRSLLLYHTEDA